MDADSDASGDLNDGCAGDVFGGGASARSNRSASAHTSRSRVSQRVPTVIGGGSSISSIIGPGNYFDDTVQRSLRVVAARKVVCPKDTRGLQGSRDYSRQHAAATAALPDLFGAAKH
jgi:hypothetical protein